MSVHSPLLLRRPSNAAPAQPGQVRDVLRHELARATAPCVTTSFQADGVVLLHMLRSVRPGIPVLFVDTLHHFRDVLAYRDDLAARWGLNVVTLGAAEPQRGLWRDDVDGCCARHKVAPLFAALEAYDLWLTALRREQSPSRADLEEAGPFQLPGGRTLRKVSPLAGWTLQDVWSYARTHEIPLLPLYDAGYTSIGCEPCTTRPQDPSNVRSGRWGGRKMECGMHVPARTGQSRA